MGLNQMSKKRFKEISRKIAKLDLEKLGINDPSKKPTEGDLVKVAKALGIGLDEFKTFIILTAAFQLLKP